MEKDKESIEIVENADFSWLSCPWFKPLVFISIFILGATLGTIIWPFVKLPFSNPLGVVSVITRVEFNPTNNILRFLVLVSLSPLLLAIVYALNIRKSNDFLFGCPLSIPTRASENGRSSIEKDTEHDSNLDECAAVKEESPLGLEGSMPGVDIPAEIDLSMRISRRSRITLALLLALFTLIISLATPPQSRVAFPFFEPYHDGESLGSATIYLKGQVPYEDFVCIHGLYEDPLRSVLGFKLFGRSIGALWTIETINHVVTIAFLVLLLCLLFQGNFLYIFIGLLALIVFYDPYTIFNQFKIPARDTMLIGFLIAVILLYRLGRKSQQRRLDTCLLGFFCAFIPIVSFAYSIDRGLYATAAFLILLLLAYPLYFHKRINHRKLLALAAISGIACAVILIGSLLSWEYLPFAKFLLGYPSTRKELIDGLIFPRTFKFYAMCLLIAANTYWLFCKAMQTFHQQARKLLVSLRVFLDNYMIEFTLLLLSIFTFRNALGRPDWGHILYSTCLSFVLSLYILIKYYLHPLLAKDNHGNGKTFREARPPANEKATWSPAFKIMVIAVAICATVFSSYQLSIAWERPEYIKALFPAGTKDSEVVPREYKQVVERISPFLQPDDDVVTVTNDASWYYLLDKRCPVRFPSVIIGSLPDDQREMVKQMDEGKVKFVIYRSNAWFYNIDNIPQSERLSILFEYIHENYHPFYSNGAHDVWVSNKFEPRPPSTVIDAGGSDNAVFERGWYEREGAPGEGYRWTQKTAVCEMANDPSAKDLLLKVGGFPAGAGTAEIKVSVNGSASGPFTVVGSGETLRIGKPANAGGKLRIEIENVNTFIPDIILQNKDTRVLGICVWRIWQE